MRDLGSEDAATRARREWFDAVEKQNIERVEAGATTITQLVTGLYGVLFAVLAFSDVPAYLTSAAVRWTATIGVLAFFGALVAALTVQFPRRYVTTETYNVSQQEQVYHTMVRRKVRGMRWALVLFLVGTLALGAVILVILWA